MAASSASSSAQFKGGKHSSFISFRVRGMWGDFWADPSCGPSAANNLTCDNQI